MWGIVGLGMGGSASVRNRVVYYILRELLPSESTQIAKFFTTKTTQIAQSRHAVLQAKTNWRKSRNNPLPHKNISQKFHKYT